jgi:hypothetical protein
VGGEEDPWEWGSVRSGALWRYCGTTERSGTKGRVTYLIISNYGLVVIMTLMPSKYSCKKNSRFCYNALTKGIIHETR